MQMMLNECYWPFKTYYPSVQNYPSVVCRYPGAVPTSEGRTQLSYHEFCNRWGTWGVQTPWKQASSQWQENSPENCEGSGQVPWKEVWNGTFLFCKSFVHKIQHITPIFAKLTSSMVNLSLMDLYALNYLHWWCFSAHVNQLSKLTSSVSTFNSGFKLPTSTDWTRDAQDMERPVLRFLDEWQGPRTGGTGFQYF